MCGIAGLFSKSSPIEERLGAHLSAMLSQLADRGPDSAGVALYRDPAPPGACKVSLFSPEPACAMGRAGERAGRGVRRTRRARGPRLSCAVRRRRRAAADVQGWLARAPSRAAGDERRRADRDLQGGGRPARLRRALRARRRHRDPRARAHADGDGEPGHDRALPPVLDRPRPLPRPQRLALEPQPAARSSCADAGSSSRPTTTPRSRPGT